MNTTASTPIQQAGLEMISAHKEGVLFAGSHDFDQLCINAARVLSIDMSEKAHSGHPGLPLGAAPMAYTLWDRFLRHNPANPRWVNRDRFILSAGHGCELLYSLLHLTGYNISLDDLENFRQWGSKTTGHPEYDPDLVIEATMEFKKGKCRRETQYFGDPFDCCATLGEPNGST